MKGHKTRRNMMAAAGALALLLLARAGSASLASALQAEGYDLSWWTVDGGGGSVADASSGYTLSGTAGQADAGLLTGGGYTIRGGFWGGAPRGPQAFWVYLPLLLRAY